MTNDPSKPVIKVLLVDDIAEARDGIRRLLSFESDFKVVGAATNGREGVEMARELQPDIVIMDINMPDMDGLEAASRITKALPTVGVIMMSVQDDQDYMQRAMLAGARFFLSKPPTMDKLYSTIRSVYQQYEPIRKQMAMLTQPGMMPVLPSEEGKGGGSRAGHVIVVYSPQGGVGCTTIATNLASGLMKEGTKTLLIDANLEFGDVGAFLDMRAQSTTIAEVLRVVDDLDLEYFDGIVMTHNSGIRVLLSPPRPSTGAELRENRPDGVSLAIKQVAKSYDFVVVDTSSALDAMNASLLQIANRIVLVMTPTLPCLKNIRLILDILHQSDIPPDKISLVLNKAIENPGRNQRSIPAPDKISQYFKRPLDGVIPLVDESIILNAINKGVPVIASDRDTNKAPIKHLIKLGDDIYASLMGASEEAAKDDTKDKKSSWSLFR